MAVATRGWRWPEGRVLVRGAVKAMGPLLSCRRGGCVTSGDECCTRRLTSTLGIRQGPGVMPAYRLPGLPEDEPRPRGVLPWVETGS